MKNYVLIALFSILMVFSIIVSIRCTSLERENLKLKQENKIVIDSIRIENQFLEKELVNLSEQLDLCQQKIDSLYLVKQKVVVRYKTEYIVSETITDGVKTLKDNIRCERYY